MREKLAVVLAALAAAAAATGAGCWSRWGASWRVPAGGGERRPTTTDLDRWAAAAVEGLLGGRLGEPRCKNAFFDLGANHGMAIREFIEQSSYPDTPLVAFLKEHSAWRPHEFCIFGVEGHPAFTLELADLEKELREAGVLIKAITGTVVAADSTPQVLRLDPHKRRNHHGTTVMKSVILPGNVKKVKVKAFALGEFIKQHVDPSGVCIVKMDIEGSEYVVLKELDRSGALCFRDPATASLLIDHMNVEFHAHRPGCVDIKEADPEWTGSAVGIKLHYQERFAHCGVQFDKRTD